MHNNFTSHEQPECVSRYTFILNNIGAIKTLVLVNLNLNVFICNKCFWSVPFGTPRKVTLTGRLVIACERKSVANGTALISQTKGMRKDSDCAVLGWSLIIVSCELILYSQKVKIPNPLACYYMGSNF